LGVVRAIGLSTDQLVCFLAWELALLILTGAVAGTTLGVGASILFVPHLQAGVGGTHVPPILVEIAWPTIARVLILFALLFAVALIVLAVLLARARVHEAIKLGEMA
jgi:putative ABC transport system permease protein